MQLEQLRHTLESSEEARPLLEQWRVRDGAGAIANMRGLAAALGLEAFRDLLDLFPHPQQIAAAEFGDVFFRIATTDELERDVECFGCAVPAINTAAAIEI